MRNFPILQALVLVALAGALNLLESCKKKGGIQEMKRPDYHLYDGYMIYSKQKPVLCIDGSILISAIDQSGYPMVSRINADLTHSSFGPRTIQADLTSIPTSANITQATNGNLYWFGTTMRNYNSSKHDLILARLNTVTGDTIWTKTYGTPLSDLGSCMISTKDGGLIICGKTLPAGGSPYYDIYISKLDIQGTVSWTGTYFTSSSSNPAGIIECSNGDFAVVSAVQTGHVHCLRITSTGAIIQNKSISESKMETVTTVAEYPDGNFLLCGSGENQVRLLKTDAHFNNMWSTDLGYGDQMETGTDIVLNDDGSVVIAGASINMNGTAEANVLVMKAGSNGEPQWYRSFGGERTDLGKGIVRAPDGNLLIYGQTNSFQGFSNKLFLLRMDNAGNFL